VCGHTLSLDMVLSSWAVERVWEDKRSARDCSSWARRACCWIACDVLDVAKRD
jgi:hypothetical protein